MRILISLFMVALGAMGTAMLWGQGGGQQPATAVFDNSAGRRIRDDGQSSLYGNYPDGVNCVTDRVDAQSGFYFFRTVSQSCTPAVQRSVVLDFSDAITRTPDGSGSDDCHVNDAFGQAGELNICGSNMVTDVRIIADTLFRNNALTRGTTVHLPFSTDTSFQGTGFEVAFEQPLSVSLNASQDPNVRKLFTTTSNVVAELYKNRARGGRISLGRYNMSLSMTVARTP